MGGSYSLFCYMVTRPYGDEIELVRNQLMQKVGIFSCEDFAVFSDSVVELGEWNGRILYTEQLPAVTTLTVGGSQLEHICNTDIFLNAWQAVLQSGRHIGHGWIVKVDPDAVFLPEVLRSHVKDNDIALEDPKAYFLNCGISFKMFGAIEAMSGQALASFVSGAPSCKQQIPTWPDMGEDMFTRQCLDLLGVAAISDDKMLHDGYCEANMGEPCSDKWVAFHPYKAWAQWRQCYGEVYTDAEWAQGPYVWSYTNARLREPEWSLANWSTSTTTTSTTTVQGTTPIVAPSPWWLEDPALPATTSAAIVPSTTPLPATTTETTTETTPVTTSAVATTQATTITTLPDTTPETTTETTPVTTSTAQATKVTTTSTAEKQATTTHAKAVITAAATKSAEATSPAGEDTRMIVT